MTHRDDDVEALGTGSVIDGRYRLLHLIGEGGMGRVYEGEHLDLQRRVAIKVLAAEGGLDEQLVKRFEREARALASVAHRNVVAVTDYGVFRGLPFLVMELLEGRSLSQLLAERGALPVDRAIALVRQVLAGLGHAHARGLVHRDLKPGNVWIESHPEGDMAKLLDFGFAKPVSPDAGAMLTADGIVVGTLAYMSPEQAAGGAVDHRSDLYSAGVLLFEMITGARPFDGDPIEILRAHITLEPPTLSATRPDLAFSPAIEAVVRRALEKSPAARFESAAELAQALADARTSETEPEAETLLMAPSRASVDPEDMKTQIFEEAKTWVDADAKTALYDPKTLIREPKPAEPKPAEPKPAESSTIDLRTQTIDALRVTDAPRGAPRPRPVEDSKRLALGVGIGVAVILALALGVRLARPAAGVEGADPGGETLAGAVDGADGRGAQPSTPGPSADVWAVYPRDPVLERQRAYVRGGGVLSRTTIRALRGIEREHPSDPRVNLVMARGFMNAEWHRDAVELLAEAHAKDARVASSDDFLDALVELARYKVTSDRASALLAEIYGAQAVPAIEAELAEAGDDPAGSARLSELARRLDRPGD